MKIFLGEGPILGIGKFIILDQKFQATVLPKKKYFFILGEYFPNFFRYTREPLFQTQVLVIIYCKNKCR